MCCNDRDPGVGAKLAVCVWLRLIAVCWGGCLVALGAQV